MASSFSSADSLFLFLAYYLRMEAMITPSKNLMVSSSES